MKARAQVKAWEEANRAKYLEGKRRLRLQRDFGISIEQYDAMLEAQGGVCAICNQEQIGKRLAVDHCHQTNTIRGLLCSDCNLGIGKLGDSAAALLRAADYLMRSEAVT